MCISIDNHSQKTTVATPNGPTPTPQPAAVAASSPAPLPSAHADYVSPPRPPAAAASPALPSPSDGRVGWGQGTSMKKDAKCGFFDLQTCTKPWPTESILRESISMGKWEV